MNADQKEILWARLWLKGHLSGREYAGGIAAMDLEKRQLAMDYLEGKITAEEFIRKNRDMEAAREKAIKEFLDGEGDERTEINGTVYQKGERQ